MHSHEIPIPRLKSPGYLPNPPSYDNNEKRNNDDITGFGQAETPRGKEGGCVQDLVLPSCVTVALFAEMTNSAVAATGAAVGAVRETGAAGISGCCACLVTGASGTGARMMSGVGARIAASRVTVAEPTAG